MLPRPHIFFTACFLLTSTSSPVIYCLYEFQTLSQSPYYIDKSYFLSTLFFDLKMPHNFITCPRRFGKTSMLLMIENFAQIEIDKHRHPINWTSSKSYQVFGTLNAAQIGPLMGNHLARYPVIQLNLGLTSMKDFNGIDLLALLNQQVAKCFDKFRWLNRCRYNAKYTRALPFGPYSNITQDDYSFLMRALNKTLDHTQISNSLLELCRILYNYFRSTRVIVLVDDYDSAAINAMTARSFNLSEYYDLVDTMLSRAFIDGQNYIKFSLVTATSAINFYKRQSTRLATVVHRPFLSTHQFTPFCGFLQSEVDAALKKYHLGKNARINVDYYYNGYITSSLEDPKLIYNPFGLTRYMMFKQQLKKYSMPSVQSEIVSKVLNFTEFRRNLFKAAWSKVTDRCNFTLKKTYEKDDLEKMIYLLKGNHNYLTQEKISQEKETYNRILHSFAFEQGFFTYSYGEKNHFKIPNYQVQMDIKDMMTEFFEAPPDREF